MMDIKEALQNAVQNFPHIREHPVEVFEGALQRIIELEEEYEYLDSVVDQRDFVIDKRDTTINSLERDNKTLCTNLQLCRFLDEGTPEDVKRVQAQGIEEMLETMKINRYTFDWVSPSDIKKHAQQLRGT